MGSGVGRLLGKKRLGCTPEAARLQALLCTLLTARLWLHEQTRPLRCGRRGLQHEAGAAFHCLFLTLEGLGFPVTAAAEVVGWGGVGARAGVRWRRHRQPRPRPLLTWLLDRSGSQSSAKSQSGKRDDWASRKIKATLRKGMCHLQSLSPSSFRSRGPMSAPRGGEA